MKSNCQKELFAVAETVATAGMQIGTGLIQRDTFTALEATADGITLAIEKGAYTGSKVKSYKSSKHPLLTRAHFYTGIPRMCAL